MNMFIQFVFVAWFAVFLVAAILLLKRIASLEQTQERTLSEMTNEIRKCRYELDKLAATLHEDSVAQTELRVATPDTDLMDHASSG